MAVKIRLARGGSKKRPFYRIVAADVRAPRDGAYIEKLGTYNPLLSKENAERFVIDKERLEYWIKTGARPSERIERLMFQNGLLKEKPACYNKPARKPRKAVEEKPEAAPAPAADAAPAAEAPAEAPAAEEKAAS